ncbi:DUF4157 domain-containing protein [Planktothrix agardhii 1031]|uniref:eCIS core domain-containing protein n=1 Tax=Planktothrix agardhii TaxID=1160 RepID=UPI001D0A9A81|nr:DUF4157 domain-containing protein [Planktothrix agardhii]MCB8777817.1 DUF4157 domain-containing protein [Planktothrix agardhii 1031]
MKVRLKKQNRHEVESVNQTGIQAKSLTDIRPMDNALAAPQKPQTQEINHQQIQKKQGFNFAEIPISGNKDESAARIQPKFNLSLQKKLTVGAAGDKYEQEADSVAEKVVKQINTPSGEQSTSGQGVQRQEAEEEELQAKSDISNIQREGEEEEEIQAKSDISNIQREGEEEEEIQAKSDISNIQREGEEEEIQAKPDISNIQREGEEEEEIQAKPDISNIQREGEEEEEIQAKPDISNIQREGEEEEEIQAKPDISNIQREGEEEEEIQAKSDISAIQREGEEEEEVQAKADSSAIQREGEEEEEVQAKPQNKTLGGGAVSTDIETTIQSAKSVGSPLDAGMQRKMGKAMGADFSGVKVHTDSQSDKLNRSLSSRAFATGPNLFFKQGEYNPGSKTGQELIAHELTHVVQQGATANHHSVQANSIYNLQKQGNQPETIKPTESKESKMSASQVAHANRHRKANNLPLVALAGKKLNQEAVEKPEKYVHTHADNSWVEVKRQFKKGFLNHPEGTTTKSKKAPHGMSKLLETRKTIVDKLLDEVKPIAQEHEQEKRAEIWEEKNGKIAKIKHNEKRQQAEQAKQQFISSAKPLNANAPGSTKPSSDIDVNMSGDGTEFAVSWLNQEFREKYGHGNESGQVYDVNFYGKDFVPGEVLFGDKGLIKSGELDRVKKPGENNDDKFYEEEKWRESGVKDKSLQQQEMEDQTIASLTMMRVNMEHDLGIWNEYVSKLKGTEMENILNQVEKRYQERKKSIKKAGKQLELEAKGDQNKLEALAKFKDEEELKTMAAENKAYENVLQEVEIARIKYELLKSADAKPEDIEKAVVELKKTKTKATMFANASYYSEGAVVSVVTNKQQLGRMYKDKKEHSESKDAKKALKKLELKPQEYYQSFNEQVGFAFHALHKVDLGNFYMDIPEAGKYIHRAYSMLGHFYRRLAKKPPFTEEQRRAASDWEGVKQGKKHIKGEETKGYVGKLTDEEKNPTIDRIFQSFGVDPNPDTDAKAKIEEIKKVLIDLKGKADQEYTTYLKQLFSSPQEPMSKSK